MNKQINILVSEDMYKMIAMEAGKRQSISGDVCSLSKVATEIFNPAADTYFNGDSKPKRVSRRGGDTISQDDSQNVTGDAELSKQADPYDLNIDF